MNKKLIMTSTLVSVCLLLSSGAFAQNIGEAIVKGVKNAKTVATKGFTEVKGKYSPNSVVTSRQMGVYVPKYTTFGNVVERVSFRQQQAKAAKMLFTVPENIASTPIALQELERRTGPLFKRPLPQNQGTAILKKNQAKFAEARANGTYEEAWNAFMQKKEADDVVEFILNGREKIYTDPEVLANDVVNFYKSNNIDLSNMPRVRMQYVPEIEGTVLELPVDGFSLLRPRPDDDLHAIPAEKFVVILHEGGRNQLEFRGNLQNLYRVVK